MQNLQPETNSNLLTGTIANKGIAKGKVKIIRDLTDIYNFEDGNILVAKITNPGMVQIMAKAGAIICEVGSITSHPAIVSRELGIPCLVNVSGCLAKLTDGILVEVNADEGRVEIIEKNDQNDLDNFLDSSIDALFVSDYKTIDNNLSYQSLDPLIADLWAKRILKLIDDISNTPLSKTEIAKKLTNPSLIRTLIHFELYAANFSNITVDEKLRIFNFFNNLLKEICIDDPYAYEKNLIHNEDEIRKELDELKPANEIIAKKIGRLANACYNLSYVLYSDMFPATVYDNYGPYNLPANRIMAIKEFSNLKPIQLWIETLDMPFEKISITSVYENVQLKINAISHAIYSGDLISNLKLYNIKIDGKNFAIEKIDQVSQIIENVTIKIHRKVEGLTYKQLKEIYLHQKASAYKKLYEYLNQDWRPSQAMIEEIKNKEPYILEFPEKQDLKKFIRDILDPRIK